MVPSSALLFSFATIIRLTFDAWFPYVGLLVFLYVVFKILMIGLLLVRSEISNKVIHL